jgi:hypothetical protein
VYVGGSRQEQQQRPAIRQPYLFLGICNSFDWLFHLGNKIEYTQKSAAPSASESLRSWKIIGSPSNRSSLSIYYGTMIFPMNFSFSPSSRL